MLAAWGRAGGAAAARMTRTENMAAFKTFRSKLIVAMVLVAVVPIGVLGIYSYDQIAMSVEDAALDAAKVRVSAAADEIRGMLGSARSDVLYLSRLNDLAQYLNLGPDTNGAVRRGEHLRLGSVFLTFSWGRYDYGQVRYIGPGGREVIRVDYDGTLHGVAGPRRLQDKGSRYYFRETTGLAKGDIYVSPIDLNREHGQVVLPPEPALRVATPVIDANGRNGGITIVNIRVSERIDRAADLMGRTGKSSFMVNQDGFYLYHTEPDRAWGSPKDLDTGANMRHDLPWFSPQVGGQAAQVSRHEDAILIWQTVHPDGDDPGRYLLVGQVYDRAEILAPVAAFRWAFGLQLAGTLLASGLVALLLAGTVSRPVKALHAGAQRLGAGELYHRIEVASGDELGSLAAAFNSMAQDLAHHIDQVRTTTAAKESLEHDLRLAREVQESLLPQGQPPALQTDRARLHARSVPARQVSGDIYDFFAVDDDTIVLALGDVAGKGIPAALLMAMVSVLLRTSASRERSPSRMLNVVNAGRRSATGGGRFVTMFVAVWHVPTGRLVYANAGHCPALLRRADATIVRLDATGVVIGAWDDLVCADEEVLMGPGDKLMAYSDGVIEAADADGHQLGLDSLVLLTSRGGDEGADSLVSLVIDSALCHQADEAERDDMTVWVLETL